MKLAKLLAATCALTLLGLPVWAQDDDATSENGMEDADTAAETMMGSVYVREVPPYWRPTDTIARLQELGYTNIDEFDVEWGVYEVEATAPNGNEVEIEISPVTGEILEIDDNWF